MEAYVNIQREKWETCGCTIMCDGWTEKTKLSIINFMVYSKENTIFLKSVDASDKIKDNKYIYGLLKDVIKKVGETNVVKIVTDNGSAFVKSGKLLIKKYNLYWCDAPKPGGPLTTRQPAKYKWMSGYPTPLQKIGQSLLCTGSSTQIRHLYETCPKQSNIITT